MNIWKTKTLKISLSLSLLFIGIFIGYSISQSSVPKQIEQVGPIVVNSPKADINLQCSKEGRTLDIQTGTLKISASYKNFNLLQRGNGYAFSQRKNRRVNINSPFGPSATQPGSGGRNPSLDSFEEFGPFVSKYKNDN